MICDYVILEVTSEILRIIYYSEFKHDIAKIFLKLYFDLDDTKLEDKVVNVLNKKGHIEFINNNKIYILCKCWNSRCYECGKYVQTFKVNSYKRLCEECTKKYLQNIRKNPLSKKVYNIEEFINILKEI